MIILKYSLPILCLLLTGCSFLSSHKEEKESIPLVEYEPYAGEYTTARRMFHRLATGAKRNGSLHGLIRTHQYS